MPRGDDTSSGAARRLPLKGKAELGPYIGNGGYENKMSINGQKITDAQIAAAGVQSQPNKLTGTAQQNKAVFDALVKNLVKARFNALIDELTGSGAAAQLGVDPFSGMTATNDDYVILNLHLQTLSLMPR